LDFEFWILDWVGGLRINPNTVHFIVMMNQEL
jgi:hypothetical protein